MLIKVFLFNHTTSSFEAQIVEHDGIVETLGRVRKSRRDVTSENLVWREVHLFETAEEWEKESNQAERGKNPNFQKTFIEIFYLHICNTDHEFAIISKSAIFFLFLW